MDKRWKILQADSGKTTVLQESLKISHALCHILAKRGFDSFDKAKQYFRPQLSDLHDPWLMKDMDIAIARILTAFEKKEKILVFGDYDVDGTTSVACMYKFLCKIYAPYRFFKPIFMPQKPNWVLVSMVFSYRYSSSFLLI